MRPSVQSQYYTHKKSWGFVGHQWFTSIMLATREAEIRRSTVPSQLRQVVQRTYLENTQHNKKAWQMAQVVEHLPSK
jgi:hypothetical protein